MSQELESRKQSLFDEYGIFDTPQELFEYIISKNKRAQPLPDDFKREEFLIKGCVSSLWLVPSFKDGKCHFKTDADSLITRGVASLVCDMYDGLTPDEILDFDPKFLEELGISQQLSPNRRNGLTQLCARIREFALFEKSLS